MTVRVALFTAAMGTAIAWSAAAGATPDFPGLIQQVVGSAAPPPCTICHNNSNGGLGTVTTVFGMYMRSRGLIPYDENSLRNALAAATAEQHSSSDDGISDIRALREGLDPNASLGGSSSQAEPPPADYGCGAHVAPSSRGTSPAVLFLAATAGVALARRRRLAPLRDRDPLVGPPLCRGGLGHDPEAERSRKRRLGRRASTTRTAIPWRPAKR
jgi:hypothetical protein